MTKYKLSKVTSNCGTLVQSFFLMYVNWLRRTCTRLLIIDMDTLIAPLDEMWDMGVVTLIAPDNVTLAEAVVSKIVEKMGYAGKIARTGGVEGHTGAQIEAVGRGEMVATARNSPTRIHAWAIIAGVYAATVGIEQAANDIPNFVLADGPVITADIDSNADLVETPWKLKNYGLSSVAGQLWLEDQLLL